MILQIIVSWWTYGYYFILHELKHIICHLMWCFIVMSVHDFQSDFATIKGNNFNSENRKQDANLSSSQGNIIHFPCAVYKSFQHLPKSVTVYLHLRCISRSLIWLGQISSSPNLLVIIVLKSIRWKSIVHIPFPNSGILPIYCFLHFLVKFSIQVKIYE